MLLETKENRSAKPFHDLFMLLIFFFRLMRTVHKHYIELKQMMCVCVCVCVV